MESSLNLNLKPLEDAIHKEMATMKLTPPNSNSFEFLDFTATKQRILVIVDEIIRRFTLAFCLPLLYQNKKDVLGKYVDPAALHIIEDFVILKQPLFNEPAIIKLLVFLKDAIPKDLVDEQIKDLPEKYRKPLDMLTQFRFIATWNINLTAQHEMAKENILRRKWNANEKLDSRIVELQNQLETEENLGKEEAEVKSVEINQSQHQLDELQMGNSGMIATIIDESKITMDDICKRSKNREEMLQKEATKIRTFWNNLVKDNLDIANKLRLKRQSTEQDLKLCIEKYDEEVGLRFNRTLELKKSIVDAKLEYEDCKDRFERQEIQYNDMLFKKEQEELEIREQKLMLFLMNRAARVIQLWWRKILIKRKSKKGRKGKKKK